MASFDYIPIIGDVEKAVLQVAFLEGISTKHGSTDIDRGRLYGTLSKSGATYTLDLYADVAKAAGDKVLTGSTTVLQSYFDLSQANTSGMSGRAWIERYAADDASLILLPTFATDKDVFVNEAEAAAMPGYDSNDGLAEFHSQAMQEILTSALPMAVPHLFGKSGLAAFVPQGRSSQLPDLTKIANPDQLRVAQKHLVKALSAEQAEHTEEFAAMAKAARERFEQVMQSLAAANVADEEAAATTAPAEYETGSFTRG